MLTFITALEQSMKNPGLKFTSKRLSKTGKYFWADENGTMFTNFDIKPNRNYTMNDFAILSTILGVDGKDNEFYSQVDEANIRRREQVKAKVQDWATKRQEESPKAKSVSEWFSGKVSDK